MSAVAARTTSPTSFRLSRVRRRGNPGVFLYGFKQDSCTTSSRRKTNKRRACQVLQAVSWFLSGRGNHVPAPTWEGCRATQKLSCRAWLCLVVAVAPLAGHWCFLRLWSWRWCFSLACGLAVSFSVSLCAGADPRTCFSSAGIPSMLWDLGSMHQKDRAGGTRGRVRRDGWRSPVPRAIVWGGRGGRGRARLSTSSANHRSPAPPTGPELSDASWTVYEMAGCLQPDGFPHEMADPVPRDGCDVAASVLTRCRGSRIFRPCRCGDFRLRVAAQASRTSHSRCSCNSRR